MPAENRKRVLITGAAGSIGRRLSGYRRERYSLRLRFHRAAGATEPADFEAARRQQVPRIVFASTNHVTGCWEVDRIYTTNPLPG